MGQAACQVVSVVKPAYRRRPSFPHIHPTLTHPTRIPHTIVLVRRATPNSNSFLTSAPASDFVCVQHILWPLGNAFLVYTEWDVLVSRLPQAPHFFFFIYRHVLSYKI